MHLSHLTFPEHPKDTYSADLYLYSVHFVFCLLKLILLLVVRNLVVAVTTVIIQPIHTHCGSTSDLSCAKILSSLLSVGTHTVKLSRRPLAAGKKWADSGHEKRCWPEGRFMYLIGLAVAVNCIQSWESLDHERLRELTHKFICRSSTYAWERVGRNSWCFIFYCFLGRGKLMLHPARCR